MARKTDRKFKKNQSFITLVVLVAIISMMFNYKSLKEEQRSQKKELAIIKENIKKENEKKEVLEEKYADTGSKEYIERTAREKLGLAYPDEILFSSDTK